MLVVVVGGWDEFIIGLDSFLESKAVVLSVSVNFGV